MNRRALVACALVACALVACRAVVGIKDLQLADAGSSDAATDAATDASATEAGPDASCAAQPGFGFCVQCCREANPQENGALDGFLRPCACGSTLTAACPECATSYCDGGMPSMTACGPCVNKTLKSASCGALRECAKGTACEALGKCIQACP